MIDAKERMVARTPDTNTARANAKTPAVQEAIARGGSNSPMTQTREGIAVETVHRVLAGTEGWSVHVGVPLAELNAPVSRSLRSVVWWNCCERGARYRARPGDSSGDCPTASYGST